MATNYLLESNTEMHISNSKFLHCSGPMAIEPGRTLTLLGQIYLAMMANYGRMSGKKYGVCSTFIPVDYFQHTMTLWFKYNITNMFVEDGVPPGDWYTRQQITRSIEKKTQASPDIVCTGQYLKEIHVCLDPTTATTFVACPGSPSCPT
ncbi:uncharacterized protein [Cicer arietinum]|uniref:Ribonuclease Rh-like n=1 Tax=Cicer arietinum TaxID=3827 RepID=A0A3Q7Y2N5_CICAR|nr:ribonuclease Rh-like [Cicer arietinum]